MEEPRKIVFNGTVITMNGTRDVIYDGAVYIEGNEIRDVGKTEKILERHDSDEVEKIDAKGSVVMPGLVCNHTHLIQSLYKGLADSKTLLDWVGSMVFPMSEFLDEEKTYIGAMLAIMEMIRTGTTCFADSHYTHIDKNSIDGVARAIEDSGIRGVLVRSTVNSQIPGLNPDFFEDDKVVEKESIRCIDSYHNTLKGRRTVAVEALGDGPCDEKMIRLVHDIAKTYDIGFHMHVSETYAIRQYQGMRSIDFLDSIGVLGKNSLLAHCVWVTPKEQKILADTATKVAHNPVSNMMLGDGIAPLLELMELGVDVGIGVDGAASNNNQDMFEAMKVCLLQHRAKWLDAEVIRPEAVLELATIKSAKTLRLEDTIGSLEKGKKADLIMLDDESLQLTPDFRPVSNIVLSANGYNVDTVMVDGQILLSNKEFVFLNKGKIIKEANAAARELVKKSGCQGLLEEGRFNHIR